MAEVLALRGRPVCVLASGDPFLHGVGATLARNVAPQEMRCDARTVCLRLAAARLGWALQDIETVSLHGRPIELIRPLLHPGARILALTSDGEAPAAIARLLADGFGASRLTVLEALGGADESIAAPAPSLRREDIAPLNVLAIELIRAAGARPAARPASPTLSSSMTARSPSARSAPSPCRRSRRAAANCCGTSAPARAPSPSNGCCRIHRSAPLPSRRDPIRAARIGRNAAACGVPGLDVVEGRAPKALAGLRRPTRSSSAAAAATPACLKAAIRRCGPAAGWWRMR